MIGPENAKAFDRLVAVMSGDYAQLLIRGEVIVRSADPDGWRKEMRSKARLDRLSIRTGKSSRDPTLVWAIRLRNDDSESEDEQSAAFKTFAYQHDVQALAQARGHAFDRWIVNHDGRAAGRCQTCGARAYVDTTGDTPVVDGEIIDEDCPGFWSPPDDAER